MPALNCYNRGCGKTYDPENSVQDECCHHPGLPFFHDAYKGWSCCNKKCIDFTEFLNIKGCALSKHSNVKPPEPPKPVVDKETAHFPIEVNTPKPIAVSSLKRPPFETAFTAIVPTIAASLKQKFHQCPNKNTSHNQESFSDVIIVGTKCKNGGCKGEYEGPESKGEDCLHHPGTPIFHEGMKFWSCCQKKTTDFSTFINQVGCKTGSHKWKNEAALSNMVKCRWDWHQTGNFVVVAVYAKEYNPKTSLIKINPIRLFVELEFPNENGAKFNMDLELQGIINIEESSAEMFGTKVEIKLRKAELGSWRDLNFPRIILKEVEVEAVVNDTNGHTSEDDCVDLDDVEPIPQMGRVNISEIEDVD
ncbi:cysteine and histidine rich domain containing protein [Arctopsyche grandis]|uniref:cysteine and histidine rich domain containing protein n=1 Tax=Arctopsyche grandis TaxID=121162 RepID=UPI00406D749A